MTILRPTTALATAALAGLTLCAALPAQAGTPAATVRIGPAIGRIPATAAGADVPFWNSALTDKGTVERIRSAGIRDLDFDAGSPIDLYNWRTNSLKPDPDLVRDRDNGLDPTNLTPKFTFDQFEAVARAAGARTTVHVNYGTATPAEAASWVTYANRIRHDHVKNWIIGEEVYLDQLIEPDRRVPKTAEPARVNARRYARNVEKFAAAMKAVDPSIKVGVEMWALDPAWVKAQPDNQMLQYISAWCNSLAAAPGLADTADFADIHWLGNPADDSGTLSPQLATTANIHPAIADLRAKLDAHSRPGHHVQVIAGEVNSASAGNSYTGTEGNAAYLADTDFTLLENGVRQADWFALYSGLNAALPDGDLALLSSHDCLADSTGKPVCEAPTGTPFPTYYAMRLVTDAATPGGRLLRATSSQPRVSAHAVRRPDGSTALLLVNRDARNAMRVRVPGHGHTTVLRSVGTGISRQASSAGSQLLLPPYSVTVVDYPVESRTTS